MDGLLPISLGPTWNGSDSMQSFQLSLVNIMVKKIEEAHRSQRVVNFRVSPLTILNRSRQTWHERHKKWHGVAEKGQVRRSAKLPALGFFGALDFSSDLSRGLFSCIRSCGTRNRLLFFRAIIAESADLELEELLPCSIIGSFSHPTDNLIHGSTEPKVRSSHHCRG
jgi:hypothetical protein